MSKRIAILQSEKDLEHRELGLSCHCFTYVVLYAYVDLNYQSKAYINPTFSMIVESDE